MGAVDALKDRAPEVYSAALDMLRDGESMFAVALEIRRLLAIENEKRASKGMPTLNIDPAMAV